MCCWISCVINFFYRKIRDCLEWLFCCKGCRRKDIEKEKKHPPESPKDGNTGLSNKEGKTEGTPKIKVYLDFLYEVKDVIDSLHKPLEILLSNITGKSVEIVRGGPDECQLKLTGLFAPERPADYTEDVKKKAAGRTILILCKEDFDWKLDNALFIRYTKNYSKCELMSTKTVENKEALQALMKI
ncbi:uncharacterized protein LOC110452249 isoform X2 [Mizuhopecten yessoensis]|uniref:uncharacterized protein LOC110452249 isoform X2 n=1 Tax=Mizuhopecten yessoensis TaxID=6573 RepID=UPI000B4577BD|nr:uncharacterized protein LOC110452249 isoform X2 [Mizuhopecten yessoensis]